MREDWVLADFVHGAISKEFELIWEIMWPWPTHTTMSNTALQFRLRSSLSSFGERLTT